jgi:hypothetical protein
MLVRAARCHLDEGVLPATREYHEGGRTIQFERASIFTIAPSASRARPLPESVDKIASRSDDAREPR